MVRSRAIAADWNAEVVNRQVLTDFAVVVEHRVEHRSSRSLCGLDALDRGVVPMASPFRADLIPRLKGGLERFRGELRVII
jgi:hypothetical protein